MNEYLDVEGTEQDNESEEAQDGDQEPVAEDASEVSAEDEDNDSGFFERVVDKILGDKDEGTEDASGPLTGLKAWWAGLNKQQLKAWALWFGAAAIAAFALYLFWKQVLAVIAFVFRWGFVIAKAVFGLLAPLIGIVAGLVFTPIGLVVAFIVAATLYALIKFWVMG